MQIEKLPAIDLENTLNKILDQRRTVRGFRPDRLTTEQVSSLLWASQGINTHDRRTAPSAGALYPLEIYWLDSHRLAHYIPQKHTIELLKEADLRLELSQAALSQDFIAEAPATMVIAAVYARVTGKYGEPRGVRYVDMEAGHAAQNFLLQATAEGLGCVPVGAFNDDQVSELLDLPNDHIPLYLLPVGYTNVG